MRSRTSDIIKEAIEQDILAGVFVDGERLDEASLARRFEVSRTPIREALQALSASVMIELLPNKGAFVKYPSLIKIIEIFEVTAELEGMCARLAARRITDEQLEEMEKYCVKCLSSLEDDSPDDYYYHNNLFHQAVHQASGNGYLADECLRLQKC